MIVHALQMGNPILMLARGRNGTRKITIPR